MWQVNGSPTGVVESRLSGLEEFTRFHVASCEPIAEVTRGIVRMAKMKTPSEVEQEALARGCAFLCTHGGGHPLGGGASRYRSTQGDPRRRRCGGNAAHQEITSRPLGHGRSPWAHVARGRSGFNKKAILFDHGFAVHNNGNDARSHFGL
jgi:hypothetical protein